MKKGEIEVGCQRSKQDLKNTIKSQCHRCYPKDGWKYQIATIAWAIGYIDIIYKV